MSDFSSHKINKSQSKTNYLKQGLRKENESGSFWVTWYAHVSVKLLAAPRSSKDLNTDYTSIVESANSTHIFIQGY